MKRELSNSASLTLNSSRSAVFRKAKDNAMAIGVTVGGSMVFIALLLIFFYLLYVVKPIFDGTHLYSINQISYSNTDTKHIFQQSKSLWVGTDEQAEIAFRLSLSGNVSFYRIRDGKHLETLSPELPKGLQVTSVAISEAEQMFALGLSNGSAIIVKLEFGVTYPDDVRLITPALSYPYGHLPLQVTKTEQALSHFSFRYNNEQMSFVYQDGKGKWWLNRIVGEENLLTEEIQWHSDYSMMDGAPHQVNQLFITPDQRQLFLRTTNEIFVYDIRSAAQPHLLQKINIKQSNTWVSKVTLLAGASSILVAYKNGHVDQYFQISSNQGKLYQKIREFSATNIIPENKKVAEHNNIVAIASEYYRRGFATVTNQGEISLYHATSERHLYHQLFDLKKIDLMGFSPRADALVIDADDHLHVFKVENAHPEVSWSALWHKVWYEGYPQPQYVWQSTSGSDDFEAKLSLMPLVFGTIKAAFYAMLFAVPLGVASAVYTAYFMSAKVRNLVKPTVEIMEALPTVILGFLAGLWLAPLVEENLPGLLILLLLLPLSVLVFALCWSCLSTMIRHKLFDEYKEFLLFPVIIFVIWLSFYISPMIESTLFNGDARQFITSQLGISFDQRNALVVGIAMGFAVIPTIFSIAEDAIFSVPRHLSNGSLALGATQWQTLTRVVLLTASPGIFSAIMMGLGRAVGETMIVLMATGNTPIMQWSVFEGMRTLAANIAVEMPESAIGSTHYRVLFLAAFVLFVFTFLFNTLAELVRQKLRERYSSL